MPYFISVPYIVVWIFGYNGIKLYMYTVLCIALLSSWSIYFIGYGERYSQTGYKTSIEEHNSQGS